MTAVRAAEARDMEALLGLIDEVQALHIQHRSEQFKPTEPAEVRDRIEQLLADPLVAVWVAEVAAVVRGYLVAIVRTHAGGPFTVARTFLELDQMSVQSGYRRQGIARALVTTALSHAQASGITAVELSSWSFNQDAHRAFAQLGFAPKVVRFERQSQ